MAIVIMTVSQGKQQVGAASCSRAEFLVRLMEQMEASQEKTEGCRADRKADKNADASVIKQLADKYGLDSKQSRAVAFALNAGIIEEGVFTSFNKRLTLQAALYIVAGADEYLHGRQVNTEETEYILEHIIADADKISGKLRNRVAKAYAYGFVKGRSIGAFKEGRIINPQKVCSEKTCSRLLKLLRKEEKRYRLTEDFKLIRTNGLPRYAEYYEYILDSWPNAYYDTNFNFMTNQPEPGNALYSDLWNLRGCGLYAGRMTWDSAFIKLDFDDRYRSIKEYDAADRMKAYSAFVLPREYDMFASRLNRDTGYLGLALTLEDKQQICEAAKKYAGMVLNVDYRTIEADSDWQKYMLANGIADGDLERYIAEAVRDELILECDFTAAEVSSVYYDRTPFVFKDCAGIVRVYARFRIVSDNGAALSGGRLCINSGQGRQCLYETRISDDGLSYEAVENSGWQDGYFDIGVKAGGTVAAATFDLMRSKCAYTAAFGYPCETGQYYPGTLTIKGMLKKYYPHLSEEEYLERFGYLY